MDGILIVDKPEGRTSHDVVARARRLLREKRIGHTGTLDPFATGVLVLLVGRATRLAQFLSGAEKEYEATMRLGYDTDTGDLTGTRREVESADENMKDCAAVTRADLEAALASLRGDIEQVPPMYSAKKIGGRKLYELARRGEEVEREAVRVRVSEFESVAFEDGSFIRRNGDGTCDVRARVVVSAGTYVRALAESVGAALGTGAHLAALRRTRAGEFRIERAVTLEALQEVSEKGSLVGDVGEAGGVGRVGGGGEFLLPLEAALPHMPAAHLTSDEARRARHGAAVSSRAADGLDDGAQVAMFDEGGALLAVGSYDSERGVLRPRVTLAAEK
ncbi:MAG TPA: tRNA pseudouridine(55) synthase TruB [Pyrinomonadaceae bacterium]|jgi:tRNA pseudouridine55 synthase|nr:tRNA pseudouridine(55) synthase TruB [Pyrinomonadaceae bacterium]